LAFCVLEGEVGEGDEAEAVGMNVIAMAPAEGRSTPVTVGLNTPS
jgi:hypothetical protein